MFYFSNYYYIILVLQAICVFHCIRKGRQNNWIWLIVLLPLIGCIIYIFTEIFTGRDIQNVQSGFSSVINPGGSMRKLEENLRFSDTFTNRVALADACLANGLTGRAIELYESGLSGNFTENEYVLSQLIIAYYQERRYEDVIHVAKKVYSVPQFNRSRAHILYAASLGHTGNYDQAEKEFKTMKAKFANYEARYYYAMLLTRADRADEARQLFSDMLSEVTHLSNQERRYNRQWIRLSKDELHKLNSRTTVITG